MSESYKGSELIETLEFIKNEIDPDFVIEVDNDSGCPCCSFEVKITVKGPQINRRKLPDDVKQKIKDRYELQWDSDRQLNVYLREYYGQ